MDNRILVTQDFHEMELRVLATVVDGEVESVEPWPWGYSAELVITPAMDYDLPVLDLPNHKVRKPYFRQKERW